MTSLSTLFGKSAVRAPSTTFLVFATVIQALHGSQSPRILPPIPRRSSIHHMHLTHFDLAHSATSTYKFDCTSASRLATRTRAIIYVGSSFHVAPKPDQSSACICICRVELGAQGSSQDRRQRGQEREQWYITFTQLGQQFPGRRNEKKTGRRRTERGVYYSRGPSVMDRRGGGGDITYVQTRAGRGASSM